MNFSGVRQAKPLLPCVFPKDWFGDEAQGGKIPLEEC